MIEVLVVMAVSALLLLIAVPSFTSTINAMRLSGVSSQLVADMTFARNEAIKRNSRMIVCVRNTAGTDCATTGSNWASGWVVCYDNETSGSPGNGIADGSCDVPPVDGSNPNPVVVRAAQKTPITLESTLTATQFSPTGTASAISVVLRNVNTVSTRTVAVAATGNISRQQTP